MKLWRKKLQVVRMGRLQATDNQEDDLRASVGEMPPPDLPTPVPARSSFDPNKYRAFKPMHKSAVPSLLSSESPKQNYRGFVNLFLIVFIVLNVRLIIANVLKYGFIAFQWDVGDLVSSTPCLVCCISLAVPILMSHYTERLAAQGHLSDWACFLSHGLSTSFCLVCPTWVITTTQAPPLFGGALLLIANVLWLKLFSYAHANMDLREQRTLKRQQLGESDSEADSDAGGEERGGCSRVAYPANVTLPNLLYFVVVPTLCYQLEFPQTHRIRKRWLFKRFFELLCCIGLLIVMVEQYIAPTVVQLKGNKDSAKVIEVLLKLSIPSLGAWLLMFFGLFHLWLNILGELTYFADRSFYKDWWNATTVEDYWKRWNLPVHHWLVRHCYVPVLRAGFSKEVAMLVVFVVSAVFHEFLVSVPCHTVRVWALLGMMSQVPLVVITKYLDRKLEGSQLGNIIFWLSFTIFGQPAAILLYYYDHVRLIGS